MIRSTLRDLVNNFFLHIEINTINIPYRKLPRPYRANPISKLCRAIFEKPLIRRFFGANLVTAMMIVPLMTQNSSLPVQEPPLNVVVQLDSQDHEVMPSIVTQKREFVVPVDRLRYVSQRYKSGHPGFDLNSYISDPVKSFTSGVVQSVEDGTLGLGKYVVVDHGHGLYSVYAHLKSFDVHVGQVVSTGEKLGEVGMTGYTTGPHVHFEIHDTKGPVDPAEYLKI